MKQEKSKRFPNFVSKKTPLSSNYNIIDKGATSNGVFTYIYFKMWCSIIQSIDAKMASSCV